MSESKPELLPGTLDMLVLKVVSLGPAHGWGIGQRLAEISSDGFDVNQGSLYPALQRLLRSGWIRSSWRTSELGRRARFYELTRSGRRKLERDRARWRETVRAVNQVLAFES
jgi:transcriptional regulator